MLFMTWSFKCACSSARQISASDADSVGSILFLYFHNLGSAFRSTSQKETKTLSPQRAFKQLRVLRDDRDDRPQIVQSNGRNIDAINDNLASGSFDDAEKSQSERRLARTRSTTDTDTFATVDFDANIPKHKIKLWSVLHRKVTFF